jgi:hypothetical protein
MPAAQRPQRLKPPRDYLAGFEKLDRPNLAGFENLTAYSQAFGAQRI